MPRVRVRVDFPRAVELVIKNRLDKAFTTGYHIPYDGRDVVVTAFKENDPSLAIDVGVDLMLSDKLNIMVVEVVLMEGEELPGIIDVLVARLSERFSGKMAFAITLISKDYSDKRYYKPL